MSCWDVQLIYLFRTYSNRKRELEKKRNTNVDSPVIKTDSKTQLRFEIFETRNVFDWGLVSTTCIVLYFWRRLTRWCFNIVIKTTLWNFNRNNIPYHFLRRKINKCNWQWVIFSSLKAVKIYYLLYLFCISISMGKG